MRTTWGQVREGLLRSIQELGSSQQFETLRRLHAPLAVFDAPADVVAFLATPEGSPEQKNELLGLLVDVVQRHSDNGLALRMLWLGLWPGLDGIFRRRARLFDGVEEFISAFTDVFLRLVSSMNRARVSRVAALLVRSTERDLLCERRTAWFEQRHIDVVPEPVSDDVVAPGAEIDPTELNNVEQLLRIVGGHDGDLLFRVLVLGEEQGEAGLKLGLTKSAARKRFYRAFPRVQARLRQVLSSRAPRFRVSEVSTRTTGATR
jgi:RNA polymerase sigma-70 factor (ECF subfamily)